MPSIRGLGRLTVWDVVPAVFLVLLAPLITAGIAQSEGAPYDAGGVALIVATGLSLLGGSRWPAATLLIVSVLLATYLWRGHPYGPVMLAFVVALIGAALRLPLRRSLPAAAAAIVLVATHAVAPGAPSLGAGWEDSHGGSMGDGVSTWLQAAFGIGWASMLFAVAVAVRTRRQARSQERTDQIRALVDAERLRMSHDVHDGVGHGLAAINMQASLALRSLRRNPERAEEALHAIRESSATALTELRAVLARMESGDAAEARRPGAGLADVPALVQRLEQTGMTVEVTGPTDLDVPTAVGLAAYRVVQESLTNALRHGTGGTAGVVVRPVGDRLEIVVRNPVAEVDADSNSGGGRGIPGMHARVEAVRGTLRTTRGEHTFEVRAELPLTEETS